EDAEAVLRNAQRRPLGTLRIDMPVSFGRIKVVPLLGVFRRQYPDISLRVTFNDRYIDLVEEGVDVAIRFGVLENSTLIARRLGGATLSVVASPEYFARYGEPKRPEDLSAHNCIAFTFREHHVFREWRFATADGETAWTPKGDISLSDGAAVCDAACAGHGVAQLQDFFVDAPIARGRLVPVLEKFRPSPQPISLVYPPTRHLAPKVRAFVDFMVARFGKALAARPRA